MLKRGGKEREARKAEEGRAYLKRLCLEMEKGVRVFKCVCARASVCY